jgi:hypothetical protein
MRSWRVEARRGVEESVERLVVGDDAPPPTILICTGSCGCCCWRLPDPRPLIAAAACGVRLPERA